jgi:prepilin-type N-terminal cleavage/methylation domain-containing protein
MRTPRRGFSLIELLVVIAIIGLLMAVLLPALGSARAASMRVASMSNQRQLGVALMLYADDFQDRVPLGFSLGPGEGWKQYNYLLRTNPLSATPAMRWMGLLYEHGAFSAPEAFYCPAERDELLQFDTERNPWPPDESAPRGMSTRIGYGVRPLIGWPFPSGAPMPTGMPKMGQLSPRTAIIADLMHKPERLALRHGSGLHITHADGSVRWQDRDVLDAVRVEGLSWADTDGTGFDTAFNALFLSDDPESRGERGLWAAMDR